MKDTYFAYILTNLNNTVLYVGVTNDLVRRLHEHKNKSIPSFTARYNLNKLIWYEIFPSPQEAIAVEKRIKGWGRGKKLAMVLKRNPEFKDLAEEI